MTTGNVTRQSPGQVVWCNSYSHYPRLVSKENWCSFNTWHKFPLQSTPFISGTTTLTVFPYFFSIHKKII